MTKKTKNGKAQDTENKELEQEVNIDNAPQAEEGAEQTQENLPEEEVDETAKLTAEIDDLKAQIDKQKDDYLRLMAEFDNYRRRTLREKADLARNGGESCMKAILPVIDDVERAMHCPAFPPMTGRLPGAPWKPCWIWGTADLPSSAATAGFPIPAACAMRAVWRP